MKKNRIQWHHRFVVESLRARYSNDTYRQYVRLGAICEELIPSDLAEPETRLLQAARCSRADAVVIKPEKVIIIKARIVADWHDITNLPVYGYLFRHTRQFVDYWDLPIKLQYVCAVDSDMLWEITGLYNVEIVCFRPEWVDDYLAKLPGRKRRPVRLNAADFQPTAASSRMYNHRQASISPTDKMVRTMA